MRISIVEAAVPLGLRNTLEGESMMTGSRGWNGMMEPVRETVPLKPPRLWRVMLAKPEKPCWTLKKMGDAVTVKSGTGLEDTVRVRVAV